MVYTVLKGTGVTVSNLCLGTMTFGEKVEETLGVRMVHAALDAGVNFIDTADRYQAGESERIVGKALQGRRSGVVLASKVGSPMGEGINCDGLSRRHIVRGVEDSLRRLRTDYLDLCYMHRPDPRTPQEESLEAMAQLVRDGKARYIGVSNFPAWRVQAQVDAARHYGRIGPVVTQNVYNLLARRLEEELAPMCAQNGLGLVAYNPLAGGLLTGKYGGGQAQDGTRFAQSEIYRQKYWHKENLAAVEELARVAQRHGMTLLELALRWCVQQPHVSATLLGASSMEQLQQNLAAAQGPPLEEALLRTCDTIWQRLRGPATAYHFG